MEKKKKFTAVVTCWSGTEWSHEDLEIQVDSEEEAEKWCEEHNCPWADYTVRYLKENADD